MSTLSTFDLLHIETDVDYDFDDVCVYAYVSIYVYYVTVCKQVKERTPFFNSKVLHLQYIAFAIHLQTSTHLQYVNGLRFVNVLFVNVFELCLSRSNSLILPLISSIIDLLVYVG